MEFHRYQQQMDFLGSFGLGNEYKFLHIPNAKL
jgi:hypothetical protein